MAIDEHQNWLAMQYVLGELSESERDAFEERMSNDLAICEAVTLASRLVLTARAALGEEPACRVDQLTRPASVPDHSISATHSSRSSWLAVTVVSVAMALLCLFALQLPDRSPNGTEVARRDPAAAELVSLWRSGMNSGEADSDDADELTDATGDVAVPGWMLAAVSLEAAADGPSEKVQEN